MPSDENRPPLPSISSSSLSNLMNPPDKPPPPSLPTRQPLTMAMANRQPLGQTPINTSHSPSRFGPDLKSSAPAPKPLAPARHNFNLGLKTVPTPAYSTVDSRRAPEYSPNVGAGYVNGHHHLTPTHDPYAPRRYHNDPFLHHFDARRGNRDRPYLAPIPNQRTTNYPPHPLAGIVPSPSAAVRGYVEPTSRLASPPSVPPITPMSRGQASSSSSTRPITFSRTNSHSSARTYRSQSSASPSSSYATPSVLQSMTKRQREEEEKDTSNVLIRGSNKTFCLNGIQRPALFEANNAYPLEFTRQDPVPKREEGKDDAEENDASTLRSGAGNRGASSLNAWDYLPEVVVPLKDGKKDEDAEEDDDELDDNNEEDVKGSCKKPPKMKKARRPFSESELWAIHVLWKITMQPMKGQRQRLGFWLGVPTKHIAVWFQNRRQEEKKINDRLAKEARLAAAGGGVDGVNIMEASAENPTPVSSQKKRATPASSRKTQNLPETSFRKFGDPSPEQKETMNAIISGDLTRDLYFENYPVLQEERRALKRYRSALGLTSSGLMDQWMETRDADRGDKPRQARRMEGEPVIGGDGNEYKEKLLLFMSSDGPEPDEAVRHEDDEDDADIDTVKDDEEDTDTLRSEDQSQHSTTAGSSRSLGLGLPSSRSYDGVRATSMSILSRNPRARKLYNNSMRSASGSPALTTAPIRMSPTMPPRPIHNYNHDAAKPRPQSSYTPAPGASAYRFDMARASHQVISQQPHRDSFQRSQSLAVIGSDSPSSTSSTLTTPDNTPFGRSQSFHARTAHDRITEEQEHGATCATIYAPMDPTAGHDSQDSHDGAGDHAEPDKEMLEAAQQLFSISGWSSSSHSSGSNSSASRDQ